ncbi:trypsin-like peptidase domain-containing protein [Candidatus Woesearchaeota archaeon]|nr:trypsin-like peptidase domain-containing protein [Candidatus Woesearchaeota archaeon]
MAKFNLNPVKALIASIILIIAISGSLIFYYNAKVNELNREILTLGNKLDRVNENLKSDISSLNQNLTSEIDLVDSDLRNFKMRNKEEINTLTGLIDEIEKQSEIQLGELRDDLKSIQVKSQDFTAIIDDVIQSVVSVGTNKGLGSGVVIDSRGFIVTNYHVVEGASIIRVLTYSEDVYNTALIGYNDVADVAVLKVDASLPALRFGDSDDVRVGEKVIALGNPAGLSFTVTEGIISAVHRKGPNDLPIYLQTDVPINPGNSGGPLVDANSEIIGLNNFKVSGLEGLGFAVESNTVKDIADDVIAQYLQSQ